LAVVFLAMVAVTCPAMGQRRSVYPDEAVGTRDALVRVRELTEGGNMPEALRVLQKTLEAEGDQLLLSSSDADLYLPVRQWVHDLLLTSPELLLRYRQEETPRAQAQLAAGHFAALERDRLLTAPGLEAALRLAQLGIERADFEAARLTLEQLERHPDRTPGSPGATDAARLAGVIAGFLGREDVTRWAQRWATQAGLDPGATIPARLPAPPPGARRVEESPLQPAHAPNLAKVPGQPLQSVVLDEEQAGQPEPGSREPGQRPNQRFASIPWVFPSVVGDSVFVNNGESISAWDSATLSPLWIVTPSRQPVIVRDRFEDNFSFMPNSRGLKEDVASVTVSGNVALGATGIPESGQRRGDRRIHAVNTTNGGLLWSVDPSWLDPRLEGAFVRGPIVVDGNTAVIALRRPGMFRRVTNLYQVGIDLYTGALRWTRLVGSVGNQPFGRAVGRPDGGVIAEGVVYRGDEMGLLSAYEVGSGRPRWVRLTPVRTGLDQRSTGADTYSPFEIAVPVVHADSITFLEPDKARIIRVSRHDGKMLGSRDASAMGDPRYLLRVGDYLASVGNTRVAFVKLESFEQGTISLSGTFSGPAIAGRAIAANERLLLPIEGGVAVIDPSRPTDHTLTSISSSGNIVLPHGPSGGHIIAADQSRLHSYLGWNEAEALLKRRVEERPRDPQPLLTYIELASRTGRADLVPGLADRALTLLRNPPSPDSFTYSHSRLFDLLLGVTRASRGAWLNPAAETVPGQAPMAVRDVPLLDAIIKRLAAVSESPAERVSMHLETAWVRELQQNPGAAVESYQQVLIDPSLGEVTLNPGDLLTTPEPGTTGTLVPAQQEATDRLAALLKRVGPTPYLAFDEEARRGFEDPAITQDAGRLAALARAYPAAAITPAAWQLAGEAFARSGKPLESTRAIGAGLRAAELGASIGREDQGPVIGRLAGALLARTTVQGQFELSYRLLKRLAREYPGLVVDWEGSPTDPAVAAATLVGQLAVRPPLALIGPSLRDEVQVLDSWRPIESVVRGLPGDSGDTVVMLSEALHQVSLWGVSAEDGRLHQLWTRPCDTRPVLIRATPDQTMLFWPNSTGGGIESISSHDGSTLWRTQDFAAIFADVAAAGAAQGFSQPGEGDRIATPLDGQVRPDDLLVCADADTLTLVQRKGWAAGFNLNDGTTLWHTALELNRIYEVEQVGPFVLVGGSTTPRDGQDRALPAVLAIDDRTGKVHTRLGQPQIGDHSRWMRATPEGDAIIATSEGILRFDPQTGAVKWTDAGTPGEGSTAGWIVGDGLFVLDGEAQVWRLALADGTHAPAPLDSRRKVSFPTTASVMNNSLALTSSLGIVVFGQDGTVLGVDALEDQNAIEPPVAAQSMLVAIEAPQRDDPGFEGDAAPSRLFMFNHPTAKLIGVERIRLHDAPRTLTLIDGKVLIGEGTITIVLDAPVQSPGP